jgi:hypothetical protein
MVYNNSAYDGNDPASNSRDDAAIDNRKQPLLPGGTPTFTNITSYAKGINAVTVDIDGLPVGVVLTPSDFAFRTGNTLDPSGWSAGPEPISVTVRANVGVGGSDRVTLTWRDYNPLDPNAAGQAVANGWLEVTVKPDARTALASPDVFYVGNLIGETSAAVSGDRRSVDVLDYLRTRVLIGTAASIANPYDFNRDKKVDALDAAAVRSNLARSLVLVAPPEAPSGARATPAGVASASPAATELVRRRTGYRPAL